MAAFGETKKLSSSSFPLFIWILEVIIVLIFCSYVIRICLTPWPPNYRVTNLYIPMTKGGDNVTVQDHVEINHQNATLIFSIAIRNPNKAKGIFYDETKITAYKNGSIYGMSSFLPGFYQDGMSHLSSQVLVNGEPNKLNQGAISENDTVKVEVETNVKYKILAWTTKRHLLRLEASLPVDMSGRRLLVGQEGVKLKQINKFLVPRHKF